MGSLFSPVLRLLFTCSPPAVFRVIATFVINPINACARWSLAHVLGKILVSHPSVANRYTSSSVTIPSDVGWVKTSLPHANPAFPRSRVRLAMRCVSLASPFCLSASAGFGEATPEMRTVNQFFGAAITNAKPIANAIIRFAQSDDLELVEPCPLKIVNLSHLNADQG